MKVIFLKDRLVKEVSVGFATNYLIPRGIAVLATDERLAELEKEKKLDEQKVQKREEAKTEKVKELSGKRLKIAVKVDENKKPYSKIGKRILAKELKVKQAEVEIEKPIDSLGEHKAEIRVGGKGVGVVVEVVEEQDA